MLELNAENFEDEVIKDGGRVFVEFYADWCRYCKELARTIDRVRADFSDIKFCRVNTDKEQELRAKYSIGSIPTSIFFVDSRIRARETGALTKAELCDILSIERPETAVKATADV